VFVIKLDKDKDIYMVWSFVVDAPIFFGNREDVGGELSLDYTLRQVRDGIAATKVEASLARCDETGTTQEFGHPPDGSWHDFGLLYMNLGTLPRDKFYEMYERYLVEPDNKTPDITDLLIPREP